jgi:hypothetical protein
MNEASVLWWTTGLTVVAIIASPITALWVQRKGDDRRASRARKEAIFRTLWTNRARPAYLVRVDALNMIDVEFFGEQKIIDAWADLFAHYRADYKAEGVSETERTHRHKEKYATLLYEISQSLGYKIGKTHIRDDVYRPDIHNEFDEIELQTRRLARDTLVAINAMDAIPVRFMPPQVDQVQTAVSGNVALPPPQEPPTKKK